MDVYPYGCPCGVHVYHYAVTNNHGLTAPISGLAIRIEVYVKCIHVWMILKPHASLFLSRA